MTTRKAPIRKKAAGEYHHGDLKTALKRAALRLVREKGPLGFSLNEASRLAGVSPGAPYRHFAEKEALLAELACEGYQLLRGELQEAVAGQGSVQQRMVEAGMAYLRFAADRAEYFGVMFRAGLDQRRYPAVAEAGQAAFAVLQELALAMERAPGDAPDGIPPEAAERALAAWALVHGLATLAAEGALPPDLAADRERLRPTLERSLRGPTR